MIHPVLAIALVSVALVALMAGVSRLAKRFEWDSELARKGVHISLGMTTLSFPWLFDGKLWPVLVLGVLAIAMMMSSQRVALAILGGITIASLGVGLMLKRIDMSL